MKKFILIDQSIKDSGGHHLEYALRVLKAAKNSGFETILAVNKSCDYFQAPNVDAIERVFTNNFWDNFLEKTHRRNVFNRSFLVKILDIKEYIFQEILMSQVGFAYQLLNQDNSLRGLMKKYCFVQGDQKISIIAIMLAHAILKVRDWNNFILSKFSHLIERIKKVFQFAESVLKFTLFAIFFLPLAFFWGLRWRNLSFRFEKNSKLFANECSHFLVKYGVNKDDIVFIPTLGDVELLGVSICSRVQALSKINWHLLFRRNLFIGREPDYLFFSKSIHLMTPMELAYAEGVKNTQVILSNFKKNFISGQVSFYTDTEPLTEQWNMLGQYKFTTLPIPHDESLNKLKYEIRKPLVISYIGDARDEKGFQYLPKLVGDIRAAGFSAEKIIFRFQSNFNIPQGEAATRIAKSELALMSADGVDLLSGPFDSDQYSDLINTSDMLLVPYDHNNYYARSSGIFAEALKAGVPVVFPKKSWMGRELLKQYIHHCEYIDTHCPETSWHDLLAAPLKTIRVSMSPQSGCAGLLIKYRLTAQSPGEYIKVSCYEVFQNKTANNKKDEFMTFINSCLIDLRTDSGMCFIKLNKTGIFAIKLENSSDGGHNKLLVNSKAYFDEIDYRLISMQGKLSEQSVGYAYESTDDLVKAVMEIANNYQSYESSAREFAKNWGKFHSANHLIELLSDRKGE